MVSSNGINRGSFSSLFTLPVERRVVVSAVVEPRMAGELAGDGLATTDDAASALGTFGTSATGGNGDVPFAAFDFSSMRSAP